MVKLLSVHKHAENSQYDPLRYCHKYEINQQGKWKTQSYFFNSNRTSTQCMTFICISSILSRSAGVVVNGIGPKLLSCVDGFSGFAVI